MALATPDCAKVAAAAITPDAGPDMMVLAASRATSRAATVPPLPFKRDLLVMNGNGGTVAVEDRLHRRIDRRRGAALVLAELGEQLMPERDVGVGPKLA